MNREPRETGEREEDCGMRHTDSHRHFNCCLQTSPHIQVDFHTSQRVADSKVLRKQIPFISVNVNLPNTVKS